MNVNFPISFTKMSGSGNDFIIIDHRQRFLNDIDLTTFARTICRRKFSVGADGLILIEESKRADFRWQFFNADGSAAEMCGNGARCAARFAYSNRIASAAMRFETKAGDIQAFVNQDCPDSIRIRLTPPQGVSLGLDVKVGGDIRKVHAVNTGVPHVVVMVEDIQTVPVVEWGRPLRFHEDFMPAGTNVNFAQVLSTGGLHIRTYERGVENETMACGTGAVASAIVAGLLQRVQPPVRVTTSGGEELMVYFTLGPDTAEHDSRVTEVFLEGRASRIYEGLLDAEALRD